MVSLVQSYTFALTAISHASQLAVLQLDNGELRLECGSYTPALLQLKNLSAQLKESNPEENLNITCQLWQLETSTKPQQIERDILFNHVVEPSRCIAYVATSCMWQDALPRAEQKSHIWWLSAGGILFKFNYKNDSNPILARFKQRTEECEGNSSWLIVLQW